MTSKHTNRIIALLPFLLLIFGAVVGVKNEVDLFCLWDVKSNQLQESIFRYTRDL